MPRVRRAHVAGGQVPALREDAVKPRFRVCHATDGKSAWWEVVDDLDEGPDFVIAEYLREEDADQRAASENEKPSGERGPWVTT